MHRILRKSHPLLKIAAFSLVDLPAPLNLRIAWNFGSLLGLFLVIQIYTGFLLSIHYTPNVYSAFRSCIHIIRDVNNGWLLRNCHINGGSWFFICIYLHIGRGLYYGSYRFVQVWSIGIIIFLLSIGVAFLGYVLPWGQIRFWGATVITNLLSAVPYVGNMLVEWVWGGFAVGNPTLNRFFVLHFIGPFVILVLTLAHLIFLHETGSGNPLGLNSMHDKIRFHWSFTSKDVFGIVLLLITFIFATFFYPNLLGDPENWNLANPLVTPLHIKPEWYFLWAYAILRAVPNKLGGVTAIFAAIIIFFVAPFIFNHKRQRTSYYPLSQILFWFFVSLFLLLTWIGGCPIEEPFDWLGQVFTVVYFFILGVLRVSYIVWDKIID